MKIQRNFCIILILTIVGPKSAMHSQTPQQVYETFRQSAIEEYQYHRSECNRRYADFLRETWDRYEGKAPIPKPKDENPIPPKPYDEKDRQKPVVVNPAPVKPIDIAPQPKPLEPIKEVTNPSEIVLDVQFYGIAPTVRMPDNQKYLLSECTPDNIADGWEKLASNGLNNAIRDCLETRIRYNLCDWAYLQFLDNLSNQYCTDRNSATLLMAFLYCQSGYQMRLGTDGNTLYMLYGSRHQIFDKGYFRLDGRDFYPYGEPSKSLQICNAEYRGETPMSLYISAEQKVGENMSAPRSITSKSYGKVTATASVPENLISFYNKFPTSAIDYNPMTRWAMYANVPLAQKTKDSLYLSLREAINDDNNLTAANKLLNWVQTGFVYEYDDKVWGHDRAFFAEETLYYPYCDCEDRSILFSRLVRDLLGLDVALIYYPGHLATAVCFDEDVKGDAIMINGRKFTVCDPTYIGAPVGSQMPGLDYDKTEAIVLQR